MALILDGTTLAKKIKSQVKEKVDSLDKKPSLAVIIVGDDPASLIYVRNKRKDCAGCGIPCSEFELPCDVAQAVLLRLIYNLNQDNEITGILVQLPLPPHIDTQRIIEAIDPKKDVDCFHPYNCGRLMVGKPSFLPCTPAGVIEILKEWQIPVAGKHCVVVGRSNIVGKPLSVMLTQMDGTVTLCHSKTSELGEITKTADILVAAVGKERFITREMVKEGAVLIDVGINRGPDGKLCGDISDEANYISSYFTPVPSGVGPMTRAMLMRNVVYGNN